MNSLTSYLKKREKALCFLVELPRRKYTNRTFHKVRLEIKKINAFFVFLKFCVKDFRQTKAFTPLNIIFRQAGSVRKLQVERKQIEEYTSENTLRRYLAILTQLEMKEKNLFFMLRNKTIINKIKRTFHDVMPLLKLIPENQKSHFSESRLKNLRLMIDKQPLPSNQYHELRKQLKTIYYQRQYISGESNLEQPDSLVVLTDMLGEWHDFQITIKRLTKRLNKVETDKKEHSELKKLKKNILSESDNLALKIHSIVIRLQSGELNLLPQI